MTKNNEVLHPVWRELLAGLPASGLVTLIGGGGKTSLMYYLVAGLKAAGTVAFAATTAKLFMQEGAGHRTVLVGSLAEFRRAVGELRSCPAMVTVARGLVDGAQRKLAGLAPEWLDTLAGECPAIRFIVEGDGSAGLPLKGHLPHDPVVPAATRLLIPVIGAEAVGQPLAACCVHRPARAAELTGAAEGEIITADTVAKLLLHPKGYLHNCPPEARVVPLINKAEGAAMRTAEDLAATVLAARHPAVGGVVVGSIRRQEFSFIRK
ncbi:selenium cofactor biosynthesis protein YqeC [Anaeroselena agilis]|uniref:Selenium cofactor biosynthesis protein YqeC n=1 Tax=Anaeroselena agilis TaxID=3063788 RepID=A0ABU3NUN9_9FIRM|nr:selenium cofactor biosynthesis protein YqeC [Selenomonadales bacterium 4137-cl]